MATNIRRKVLTEKVVFYEGRILRGFPVYMEMCCDHCNEVIHNHLDCPVCDKNYASTTCYGDLYGEERLTCEECGASFKLVSGSWYSDFEASVVSSGGKGRVR